MTRKHRTAFTLVELLVVISIIALLIAILLPSLKRARDQAKGVVCSANLRSVGGGIWNYWTDNNGHVPFVQSPLTNGDTATNGFGDASVSDEDINPFDRENWPRSLPNVLMPTYLGADPNVFVCPGAKIGWPRRDRPLRMTYRPAAANQPGGEVTPEGEYFREHFGFMDYRMYRRPSLKMTGNRLEDILRAQFRRGTFVRDMIQTEGATVIGPHSGGVNVINRLLEVEHRGQEMVQEDLNPSKTDPPATKF